MKIKISKKKQILEESALNEQKEQKYRLIVGRAFCMGPKCMATMRVVHLETSEITAAAKGMGKTKEEAMQVAKANLAKRLQAKGLDINKIQVLKESMLESKKKQLLEESVDAMALPLAKKIYKAKLFKDIEENPAVVSSSAKASAYWKKHWPAALRQARHSVKTDRDPALNPQRMASGDPDEHGRIWTAGPDIEGSLMSRMAHGAESGAINPYEDLVKAALRASSRDSRAGRALKRLEAAAHQDPDAIAMLDLVYKERPDLKPKERLSQRAIDATQFIDESQTLTLAEKQNFRKHAGLNLLKEDTDLKNIALDAAGLIPGIGEFADMANAVDYAKKGDYLFAALSLVSMVPAVGDVIGKGGKIGAWIAKTFPKGAKAAVKYGPEIKKLKAAIESSKPMIDELLAKLEDNEQIGEYIPDVKEALSAFMGSENDSEEGELEMSDNEEENFFGAADSAEEVTQEYVDRVLQEELANVIAEKVGPLEIKRKICAKKGMIIKAIEARQVNNMLWWAEALGIIPDEMEKARESLQKLLGTSPDELLEIPGAAEGAVAAIEMMCMIPLEETIPGALNPSADLSDPFGIKASRKREKARARKMTGREQADEYCGMLWGYGLKFQLDQLDSTWERIKYIRSMCDENMTYKGIIYVMGRAGRGHEARRFYRDGNKASKTMGGALKGAMAGIKAKLKGARKPEKASWKEDYSKAKALVESRIRKFEYYMKAFETPGAAKYATESLADFINNKLKPLIGPLKKNSQKAPWGWDTEKYVDEEAWKILLRAVERARDAGIAKLKGVASASKAEGSGEYGKSSNWSLGPVSVEGRARYRKFYSDLKKYNVDPKLLGRADFVWGPKHDRAYAALLKKIKGLD